MRGVILAGGTGSRLAPLNYINKHLLPIGRKPMIQYAVEKLTASGIDHILVVTGKEHAGTIINYLGSGDAFGCTFTYRVQDAAGGIAQALGLAKDFCSNDLFCVVLGDNIFTESLEKHVKAFELQGSGAKIVLKDDAELQRFGVAALDRFGNLVNLLEKPTRSELDNIQANFEGHRFYIITGIYFYDPSVFEVIPTLEPSTRGELEITDVNRAYLLQGNLTYSFMRGGWTDAGTHESMERAQEMVR